MTGLGGRDTQCGREAGYTDARWPGKHHVAHIGNYPPSRAICPRSTPWLQPPNDLVALPTLSCDFPGDQLIAQNCAHTSQ